MPLEDGDGGPAMAASIYSPRDVCFDRNGNLYISDADNKVRKVNRITGIITTMAGKGGAVGFSGDNGPADSAQLNGPQGICTDTIGNLYIADYYNDRIRKVDAITDTITTIAGNGIGTYNGEGILATSAQINPWRILFDTHGNLFVVDQHNWRVRKIDLLGSISTVIGNGIQGYNGDCKPADSTELFLPFGLGFDRFGDLYVNDGGFDYRIRKVTTNTYCSSLETPLNLHTVNIILVYPNPANTELTITSPREINEITISNMLGQAITVPHQSSIENKEITINITGLLLGIYFVTVTDIDGQKTVRKIVKQ